MLRTNILPCALAAGFLALAALPTAEALSVGVECQVTVPDPDDAHATCGGGSPGLLVCVVDTGVMGGAIGCGSDVAVGGHEPLDMCVVGWDLHLEDHPLPPCP